MMTGIPSTLVSLRGRVAANAARGKPPKTEPDRQPYQVGHPNTLTESAGTMLIRQPWTETGQTGLYHDERPPSSIFAYPDLPQQSSFRPHWHQTMATVTTMLVPPAHP